MGLFGAAVSIRSRQHVIRYYLDRKHALRRNSSSDELDVISEQILYYCRTGTSISGASR